MYTIKVDGYVLDDPRDDDYVVENPTLNLAVNTVGEGSFTIPHNHPNYNKLELLKSIITVTDDYGIVFRGRMTGNSYDINNQRFVDMEGLMGCFNDTVVRPFSFPDDFLGNADYIAAAENGNVVEFFLKWLIDGHNAQKGTEQFKLGNVTVTDPNNYVSRSNSKYSSTWETLKSKLFDSALGGYLCIRYEADGNYIDYVSEFELTNTQEIVFGENLLNIDTEHDATESYSACIPIGATVETETAKEVVTIKSLADGDINSDLVKEGDMIYSRSAKERYGFILAPTIDTTWDAVTDPATLLNRGVSFLDSAVLFTESIEVSAADLHFSNEQVQSFRIGRNVKVYSEPHGHSGVYQLV